MSENRRSLERLLVCGSRHWTDAEPIDQQIRLTRDELELVIEGGAPGADRIARQVARRYGVRVLTFEADWARLGRRAGPARNQRMLREGRPTLVVAFTDDLGNQRSGTRHMCRIALGAGLPVTLVEHALGGLCFSAYLTLDDLREPAGRGRRS